jgi:hypothetical protein
MVKKYIFLTVFFLASLNASFQTNCVACHQEKKVDLRKAFMDALLVYGGEKNFKTGLFYYCKNPNILTSAMDENFVSKFLPLRPTTLSDQELKNMITIYWRRYKIQGKLK